MAPKRKTPSVTDGAVKAASTPAKKAKPPVNPASKAGKPAVKRSRRKVRYTMRKKTKKAVGAVKKVEKSSSKVEQPAEKIEEKAESAVNATPVEAAKSVTKGLTIEHCKQCSSFKNQASKFEKSLKEKIQGLEVSINPQKPRRGCFEVRDEEGNIFLSLLDLKRPFPELRALNVEEHVELIVSKIK